MTTNSLPLNQGQEKAADAFFEFLFSNDKEFILSGPAGVGKTFWMGHIIDVIIPRYQEMCKLLGIEAIYDVVNMTATTNKAAEVLESQTGRITSTVHSFLNLTIYEDYETGQTKLKKNPKTWTVHENKVLFVDECSMIDSGLEKVIQEGTHNTKIVYVGDRFQLAPVMEKLSPIYLKNSPMVELTEQMRTANPHLQVLNQQLRDTVETGVFNPIQLIPGSIDHLDDDEMPAQLAITFAQPTKESRILCYTNKRVAEFNEFIRDMRQLPAALQVGEILVNGTAFRANKKMISVESEITITGHHGNDQVLVEKDVYLDVEIVDVTNHLGEAFFNLTSPTDRQHFNDLLKFYKRQKNWERFFYMKEHFPDFRQRDAATVHKSQGSTYDSVFVDLGNISTNNKADEVARMLYVAFSRARNRVFLYGELAPKYGHLLQP
jgi:superfamily I DNA/RNA helicase